MRIRIPFLVIALVIVIPVFLAQTRTEFLYGLSNITASTRAGKDARLIDDKFGKENILVLLVPNENPGKENELADKVSDLPHVKNIVSYASSVQRAPYAGIRSRGGIQPVLFRKLFKINYIHR